MLLDGDFISCDDSTSGLLAVLIKICEEIPYSLRFLVKSALYGLEISLSGMNCGSKLMEGFAKI